MFVIITGSTKGIGLALARKFLEHGDHVLICSRSDNRVAEVVADLEQKYGDHIIGTVTDVSNYDSVLSLAETAIQQWGKIDIWINNAGTTAYDKSKLQDQDPSIISAIVNTNLIGTMYGCKVAINHQVGHIFNIDGLGSNGRVQDGLAVYGTTKRGIPYLTDAIAQETEHLPIGVHTLSPGMVLTDLLVKNSKISSRKIFNILAEHPSVVAEFLVEKVRQINGTEQTGRYIRYLTRCKVIWRFLTFWRYSNRFFDDDGNLLVDIDGMTSDTVK